MGGTSKAHSIMVIVVAGAVEDKGMLLLSLLKGSKDTLRKEKRPTTTLMAHNSQGLKLGFPL